MSGALRPAGAVGVGPHPVGQEHHALFTDLDRRMLQRAHKSDVQDPGQKSLAEMQALTADERLVYDQRRKLWMEAMPAVSTTPASAALDTLKRHCAASGGDEDAQQDVLAVWGEPGVGKSKLSRQLAAFEIERLARLDFLLGHGNARPFGRTTPRSITQHVVHFEFKGAMSRIDFEREVCHELGQLVKRGDWASSLTHALRTCETRFLILDEIQFINFGGATGRQIHHSIKNITNSGTNVIIFGNDIQWVMGAQNEAEGELSRRQAQGRWTMMEIPKLHRRNELEEAEWRNLLYEFEQRLRLADPGEPGWLCLDLADYVWARTDGYLNALVKLVRDASNDAYEGAERITRDDLERVTLQEAVERGRGARTSLLGPAGSA